MRAQCAEYACVSVWCEVESYEGENIQMAHVGVLWVSTGNEAFR